VVNGSKFKAGIRFRLRRELSMLTIVVLSQIGSTLECAIAFWIGTQNVGHGRSLDRGWDERVVAEPNENNMELMGTCTNVEEDSGASSFRDDAGTATTKATAWQRAPTSFLCYLNQFLLLTQSI
jgi:hypothetical protein